jgi:hypothetical protein
VRVADIWKKRRYHGVIAAEQGATLAYHLHAAGLLPECKFMILIDPGYIEPELYQASESCAVAVMLPIGRESDVFSITRETKAACVQYAESWTQREFDIAFDCVQKELMCR